jgi:hypothetical protein
MNLQSDVTFLAGKLNRPSFMGDIIVCTGSTCELLLARELEFRLRFLSRGHTRK